MMNFLLCCPPNPRPYSRNSIIDLGSEGASNMGELVHQDNQAARLTKRKVVATSLAECLGIALIISSIVLSILVAKSFFPGVNEFSVYAGLAAGGLLGCLITVIATNRLYEIYKKYQNDKELAKLYDPSFFSH